MYTIDEKDEIIPWNDVPGCEAGAPCPVVFSDEFTVVVAYYGRNTIPLSEKYPQDEKFVFVRFDLYNAMMFGPPNEEAYGGHPLAARGLRPCEAFLVKNSSWIRQLERMNSIHPYHRPEKYDELTHYILTFHDSTFECVAKSFSLKTVEYETGMPHLLSKIDNFLKHPDIPNDL